MKQLLAKFFMSSTLHDNGTNRPGTNSPKIGARAHVFEIATVAL